MRKPQPTLAVWTIYYNPSDHPGQWVLRAHDVPGGPRPDCQTATSLEEIRGHVPFGLVRLLREPDDDPVVVESWI